MRRRSRTARGLIGSVSVASIDWDSDELTKFPGARRLVTLDIEQIVELPNAVRLRWDVDADSVRSLRLIEKTKESDDVTSFIFEARDGGLLAAFEPGQHLPIEVSIPEGGAPVAAPIRCRAHRTTQDTGSA